MPSILIVSGPNKGDYYPVTKPGKMSLGRLAGCTIQIVDDSVSREHAVIEYDGSSPHVTITDRGSSHGTTIRGEKITDSATVEDGQEVHVGGSSLVFTTKDFDDRESALKDQHLKRWFGEDHRQTMV